MPSRTAQAVPLALPMLLLLLVMSARAAEPEEQQREEAVDPEVTACRQQCARQRQFGAAERRHCLRQCDEYGRAKRREEQREEGAERERDRCLHECRAGPPKPGCERRCREAYERATRRRGDAGPRGLASVPARRVRGDKLEAAAA
ncbi:unnamed protein product [Miscanthus lutarioriparius]|uniref:Uncharacterized protein n=1 Tax=Miscanthus lutarioriparius TaxID=422564 RepID=A0A811RWM7_9POAL|nr:unnamed protein product [Miscanthus lutarioriparius]